MSVDAAPPQPSPSAETETGKPPEMYMIPSPGDSPPARPLGSSDLDHRGYDSLAPITLPRYHLEVAGGANRGGTPGVYALRGDGRVGGRQEGRSYDNRAYEEGEPQRDTHF